MTSLTAPRERRELYLDPWDRVRVVVDPACTSKRVLLDFVCSTCDVLFLPAPESGWLACPSCGVELTELEQAAVLGSVALSAVRSILRVSRRGLWVSVQSFLKRGQAPR